LKSGSVGQQRELDADQIKIRVLLNAMDDTRKFEI